MVYMLITSCSASKDDSIPIILGSKIVDLTDYLDDGYLISKLIETRKTIFSDPRAKLGNSETYAFDLYVRAGKAYSLVFNKYYYQVKRMLVEDSALLWFFISGGYGIINALEKARKYQATFNRSIAYQKKIPFATNLWKPILTEICDNILQKFRPEWVYVFGSRDYTNFIKNTSYWERKENIKIFESRGSSGVYWISTKLGYLIKSILNRKLNEFNEKYEKFVKQTT